MKVQEYRNLRINDPIIDKKGNLTKAYDIDRMHGLSRQVFTEAVGEIFMKSSCRSPAKRQNLCKVKRL